MNNNDSRSEKRKPQDERIINRYTKMSEGYHRIQRVLYYADGLAQLGPVVDNSNSTQPESKVKFTQVEKIPETEQVQMQPVETIAQNDAPIEESYNGYDAATRAAAVEAALKDVDVAHEAEQA